MRRVSAQVEALRDALERGRARLDAEAVHDARVAARRLITFLALAELRVLRHDLRRLVRGLGRLRDLDVALEALPSGAFQAWLAGERKREAARVRPLLGADVEAVLTALTNLPAPSPKAGERGLAQAREGVRQRTRAAKRAGTIEAVHALRKALRRERYVREWLGRDVEALRARQELVGVACDLASLQRLLVEAGDERGARVVQGGVERLVPLLLR